MIDALYALLAKVGFTDPLHAPLTHMPVGLAIGAFVFFAVAIAFKRERLVLTARHVSILAFVFVFPTILFGVFDWIHFYRGILMPAIKAKMALAVAVTLLLGAGIVLGSEIKVRTFWMTVIYALSVLCVVALGWYGGGLVYGRGTAAAEPAAAVAAAGPAMTGPAMKGPAPGGAPTGGNAMAGQAVFAENCQACHAGGGNIVTPLLPVKGSKKLASLELFTAFLRKPAMPDGSAGDMPAFPPEQLGEAKVKDLYAFAASAWK